MFSLFSRLGLNTASSPIIPASSAPSQKPDMISNYHQQIVESLNELKQDQFKTRQAMQEQLNRQRQEQAAGYQVLANAQDRIQSNQTRLFNEQRFMIVQMDDLKKRLNLGQFNALRSVQSR
ncbi:hypothetical protein [Vampirovibrio sp.]|uniref:hypothetical protein n=1 Tax=Vampirovibrio sp. TaxID=2717857 RepID=UPI0035944917